MSTSADKNAAAAAAAASALSESAGTGGAKSPPKKKEKQPKQQKDDDKDTDSSDSSATSVPEDVDANAEKRTKEMYELAISGYFRKAVQWRTVAETGIDKHPWGHYCQVDPATMPDDSDDDEGDNGDEASATPQVCANDPVGVLAFALILLPVVRIDSNGPRPDTLNELATACAADRLFAAAAINAVNHRTYRCAARCLAAVRAKKTLRRFASLTQEGVATLRGMASSANYFATNAEAQKEVEVIASSSCSTSVCWTIGELASVLESELPVHAESNIPRPIDEEICKHLVAAGALDLENLAGRAAELTKLLVETDGGLVDRLVAVAKAPASKTPSSQSLLIKRSISGRANPAKARRLVTLAHEAIVKNATKLANLNPERPENREKIGFGNYLRSYTKPPADLILASMNVLAALAYTYDSQDWAAVVKTFIHIVTKVERQINQHAAGVVGATVTSLGSDSSDQLTGVSAIVSEIAKANNLDYRANRKQTLDLGRRKAIAPATSASAASAAASSATAQVAKSSTDSLLEFGKTLPSRSGTTTLLVTDNVGAAILNASCSTGIVSWFLADRDIDLLTKFDVAAVACALIVDPGTAVRAVAMASAIAMEYPTTGHVMCELATRIATKFQATTGLLFAFPTLFRTTDDKKWSSGTNTLDARSQMTDEQFAGFCTSHGPATEVRLSFLKCFSAITNIAVEDRTIYELNVPARIKSGNFAAPSIPLEIMEFDAVQSEAVQSLGATRVVRTKLAFQTDLFNKLELKQNGKNYDPKPNLNPSPSAIAKFQRSLLPDYSYRTTNQITIAAFGAVGTEQSQAAPLAGQARAKQSIGSRSFHFL